MKTDDENWDEFEEFRPPQRRELTVSLKWSTMLFVVLVMWFFLDR